MNLNGFVRDPSSHFAGEKLRDGGIHAKASAGILLPRGFTNEQASCVDLGGHIGKHELDRLELRDRMAESHALLRPGERGFKRALSDAGGLRGDSDTSSIERGERNLVPFALVPNAIGGGHFAVSKD